MQFRHAVCLGGNVQIGSPEHARELAEFIADNVTPSRIRVVCADEGYWR